MARLLKKTKMQDTYLYTQSNLCVVREELKKIIHACSQVSREWKKGFLTFLLPFFSVFHLLQTMNSTVFKHARYGARLPTDLSLNLSESQCSHLSRGSNNHSWLAGWL